jgi:hypothetical protein
VPTNALGGQLAFYGVQENIDKGVSEEESNSSSYGANKANAMFGPGSSQRGQIPLGGGVSPGRISPIGSSIKLTGAKISGTTSPNGMSSGASGKMNSNGANGIGNNGASGKINRDQSPPPVMLNRTLGQGSFKGLGQVGRASSFKQRGEFSDIRRNVDEEEDRPVADLRASFAAMGRAPSYRNTMIIENSSNNDTIRVMVDNEPPSKYEETASRKMHRNSLNGLDQTGASMGESRLELCTSQTVLISYCYLRTGRRRGRRVDGPSTAAAHGFQGLFLQGPGERELLPPDDQSPGRGGRLLTRERGGERLPSHLGRRTGHVRRHEAHALRRQDEYEVERVLRSERVGGTSIMRGCSYCT